MCFGQSGGKRNLAKDANSPQHVVVPNSRTLNAPHRWTSTKTLKAWINQHDRYLSILKRGEKNSFAWILCLSYSTRVQPSPVTFSLPLNTTPSDEQPAWQRAHCCLGGRQQQKKSRPKSETPHKTSGGGYIFLSLFSCHCNIINHVNSL